MKMIAIDPAKLSVVFGSFPMYGFAPDKMIEIRFEEARYKESFDNRGEMTRIKINQEVATLNMYMLQNSPCNSTLSSFVEADRINNSGCFPIIIKDPSGDTTFACAAAYIQNIPIVSYGSENAIREWVIRASNISKFI